MTHGQTSQLFGYLASRLLYNKLTSDLDYRRVGFVQDPVRGVDIVNSLKKLTIGFDAMPAEHQEIVLEVGKYIENGGERYADEIRFHIGLMGRRPGVEQEKIREFLSGNRKDLISIKKLEQLAGVPRNTINNFLAGQRDLPDRHIPAIVEQLKTVGYDPV